MCLTNRARPQIIMGMGLPADEALGSLCPAEDALLTFIRKGRDIFT